MNYKKRLSHVRAEMQKEGCDAILFTNLPNLFYLSGFRGSDGALLITDTQAVLLVDGRYGTQAKMQAPDCVVVVYPEKTIGISDEIKKHRLAVVGFESRAVSHEFFEGLKAQLSSVQLKPVGKWIVLLRRVKDEAEIQVLKKANHIADEAAREILDWVKPGIMERDLATELEYRMKKKGAEKASFSILVAGGERGSLPHAMPTERKLQKNEFFFLDFGCTYEGYQTDQTLTIALGKPDPTWLKIYQIVKEAHDLAIEALKPSVPASELDRIARDHIAKSGYRENFSHSLGHGVGIEVHEYPPVSSKSDAVTEEHMVLTIEPGIYLPEKGGVRIEDTLLVTKGGSEALTTLDKELQSL